MNIHSCHQTPRVEQLKVERAQNVLQGRKSLQHLPERRVVTRQTFFHSSVKTPMTVRWRTLTLPESLKKQQQKNLRWMRIISHNLKTVTIQANRACSMIKHWSSAALCSSLIGVIPIQETSQRVFVDQRCDLFLNQPQPEQGL